jgi:hypothetical protein
MSADREADLGAWRMLAEPLQIDEPLPLADPVDDPWWVKWIVWPATFVLTVAACFVWPLW